MQKIEKIILTISLIFISQYFLNSALAKQAGSKAKIELDSIIVTTTKEQQDKNNIPASIGVITNEEISKTTPAHPAEILNQKAGVHINNIGGEGHMSAIRQPITTKGVYLFLEDGIPTRPTGLFNHNALYEINIPQAESIEIVKGPGSALYGSESIGGIINSITKKSPTKKEFSINPELGSYGWKRSLISVGSPLKNAPLGIAGMRFDLNLTDSEGYRDASDYSRYSGNIRLDGFVNDDTSFKTILAYNYIDQAGVSSLNSSDYHHNSKKNEYHGEMGNRKVNALRISTEFAYEPDNISLFTLTPFFRHNNMDLMPSWMLSYDANIRDYDFQSYGLLTKYRHKFPDDKIELITGIDIDYTPFSYQENDITANQEGDIYVSYTETGTENYNFAAKQLSLSPYLHSKFQAQENLAFSAGLRFDYFSVDYNNNLSVATNGNHLRVASQKISFNDLSPKLGMVYNLSKNTNLYANYRHSFRAPSVTDLFRSGKTTDTDKLKPVKTDSFEIGVKGKILPWLKYETALYHMIVKDDIVTYIDGSTRKNANAGKTTHQGIEASLTGKPNPNWDFNLAWSFSKQEYDDFTAIYGYPSTEINYAGNKVAKAPKMLGNISIGHKPIYLPKSYFSLELQYMGKYYVDETNTDKYSGHNLVNFRSSYELNKKLELYARAMNITNKLYSSYTSKSVGKDEVTYRPGQPRSFYIGVRKKF